MKLSYCCLVCIFVVVLSDANAENHGDGVNEQQLPHIITLVDQLTANYLKEEDHLWAVIQKREDSTLQQIHDVHQSFLKRQYGESNVIHSNIFMSPNPNVLAHLSVINQTSYEIAHEFFGHPNYSALSIMALNAIDLDKTFELVFEQTANSTEFWSNLKNSTLECQSQLRSVQSEYQALFEYYKDIQASSLRTYITAQLSYMMLFLHESGEYRNLSIAYQERFRRIYVDVQSKFKSKLEMATREIWSCDPLDYNAPGVGYEITNFLTGYIDAEVNLNAEGSCALTCSDYSNTKNYGCSSDTLCAGLKPENRSLIGCNGKVRGCYNFDDSISVCPAETNVDGVGRRHRYKYVTSGTGLKLGNVTSHCTNELKMSSWGRWFVKCSNCFCYCDDKTNSERYFSLRPVVSDIQKNMVVTGVALTKRNGMIQFVIAERELDAFATVNRSHIEYAWKLGDQFVPNDNDSRESIDYHALNYENRSLNLDTVIGQPGYVVTGVRFKINSKGHLQLEVRFTALHEGKLIHLNGSYWQSNESGGKHRINTDHLGIPTKTNKPSTPNFKMNSYIRFGPTNKNIDLSQTTVPFIDGLKVESKFPTALSGVGLYYKSSGFVAPKIVLYAENLDSLNK